MALSKIELYALINSNIADNTTGQTTNQKVREVTTQMTNSLLVGIKEVEILRAPSTADQVPSALDTPLKVKFGSAVNNTNDKVMVSATGDVTFNEAGIYPTRFKLQAGRSGSSGTVNLWLRILINGSQVGESALTKIDTPNFVFPMESRVVIDADKDDVLTVEIMRDSAGANEGRLLAATPTTLTWTVAPSALIVISDYVAV